MTDKKREKWVFILNPEAGNGATIVLEPVIREKISKAGINAELIHTKRKGHASELAKEYLEKGFTHFIAVGGDGTLNEMAGPLLNAAGITTGIIPAGTGNDFIQILGFPGRFSDSDWDIFFRAATRQLDAGTVNGMIFLNGMGLGFDAEVAACNYDADGNVIKGWKYKYIFHIIKTLFLFREKMMRVTGNKGSEETKCFINTVAVGRRFAGGFYLTPEAVADDGLLDVCMISQLTLAERFPMLLKVPSGKHIHDKRVNYYKTSSLSLSFPEKMAFHVDGEINYSSEFEIGILPAALNIIYNPSGNHFFKK